MTAPTAASTVGSGRGRPEAHRVRRRVGRRSLASLVVALLVVTVAMIGSRLSDTSRQYEILTGRLDRPTSFQSGDLVVGDVRAASRLRIKDDVLTTPGVFVVVDVAVRARGHRGVVVQEAQLLSPRRTYLPFSSSFTLSAETGFETSSPVIFEVDPADLAGLTLECSDRGFIYRYYTKVQTPLGITSANVDAWRAAARGAELPVSTSEQSKALS